MRFSLSNAGIYSLFFTLFPLFFIACEDDGSRNRNNSCQIMTDCDETLVCVESQCVVRGSICVTASDCLSGQECVEKNCKTSQTKACNDNTDCGQQVCYKNECTDPIAGGEACEEDSIPCAASFMCFNHYCEKILGLGDPCDELNSLCEPENLRCIAGTCQAAIPIGGECTDDWQSLCAAASQCIEGICTHLSGIGEKCGEAAYTCSPLLNSVTCINNICTKVSQKDENCHPVNQPCANPQLLCILGKCIEKMGDCAIDADCQSDSYCCTESACETKNVCISYGEGPRQNLNLSCSYQTVVGLFEADVQCGWEGPPENDLFPNHSNVYMTPMIMNLPHDSGSAQEIAFIAYNCSDGSNPILAGTTTECFGVIRIINGETCEQIETIYDPEYHFIGASSVGMIDLDNDGNVEIVAYIAAVNAKGISATHSNGYVAYRWDENKNEYVRYWTTTESSSSPTTIYRHMDGPSFADLDDDGYPEVIGALGDVYNGRTGERINSDKIPLNLGVVSGTYGYTALGKLTQANEVEIIARNALYYWSVSEKKWIKRVDYTSGTKSTGSFVYADFGTWDAQSKSFDFEKLDGIAEIVGSNNGIFIMTHSGEIVFSVEGYQGSGPAGVADFDGDTLPEITAAFGNVYIASDPRCKIGQANCSSEKDGIMWSYPIHDLTSRNTTSSVFDFDYDGRAEVTLADECYVRVFDGKSGNVLFSKFRNSCGQSDNPVIVDSDGDGSAEMIILQDYGCGGGIRCAPIDPIHEGIRCTENNHCKSGVCNQGFCQCTSDNDCNSHEILSLALPLEYLCTDAIDPSNGKRCRAAHPVESKSTGIRILRDRLDRWASSRSLWNQFSYNITNINDDGTIPQTSKWIQNFLVEGLNNFRSNSQGSLGANSAPDITGKLNKESLCLQENSKVTLSGVICNRGTKMVAAKMPATFYHIDDTQNNTRLCTAYTSENVPVGTCLPVSCQLEDMKNGLIRMVANDDGNGGRTTVECNDKNNFDEVILERCQVN